VNKLIAVISIKKLKAISSDPELLQNKQDGHTHTQSPVWLKLDTPL